MSGTEVKSSEGNSSKVVSSAERDRERKRMDHIVTLQALLLEAGAAGLFVYLLWLVFSVTNHNGS